MGEKWKPRKGARKSKPVTSIDSTGHRIRVANMLRCKAGWTARVAAVDLTQYKVIVGGQMQRMTQESIDSGGWIVST